MKKIWAKESWSGFRMILMLMLLVCAFITGLRRQDFYGEETQTAIGWDTSVEPQSIPDLGENTVISQEFYAQDGILELIYVSIGAHGTTGSMLVTLQDADGAILATRELPCNALVENGAQGISFHIRVQPGEKYVYTISFSGITDEYPQLQTLPCLSEGELGALTVNTQAQEQKLYGLFVYQSYYTQNPLWWLFAGMTVLLFFYAVLYPLIPVWQTHLLPLFLVGHVVLGVCLLEIAAGNTLMTLIGKRLFYNCIFCFFLFAVLAVFLWRGGWLLRTGTVLCFVIGVAEYYVLEFRGSPLHPADLLSIGTAGEVSSAYKFDLPISMCAAFFLMLGFAALTSCVSVMETLVANCMELFHQPRKKMCGLIGLYSLVTAVAICLGYNVFYFELKLPNGSTAQLLDLMDYISNSFLMPFISLLTSILIGWVVKPHWIISEVEKNGEHFRRARLYYIMIRYIVPPVMLILFLVSTGFVNWLF